MNITIATSRDDDIAGAAGSDDLYGDYYIIGWRLAGTDKIYGGAGDDNIHANSGPERDFNADYVDCGSGLDGAMVRTSDGDFAKSNCETIQNEDN